MDSAKQYYAWFLEQARALPPETEEIVREAIAQGAPRLVYLPLTELWEAGRLPAHWKDVLDSFHFTYF